MDAAGLICTPSEITHINNCRIFLQLLTISDMTSIDSRKILPSGVGHHLTGSRSLLKWPKMGTLPQTTWTLWQSFYTDG